MTSPRPERHYPVKCPACQSLLAVTGSPHCPTSNVTCDWLRCKCGASLSPNGAWSHPDKRQIIERQGRLP